MRIFHSLFLVVFLATVTPSQAVTFLLSFDGDQEVPGPGDPDAVGSGTIDIDPSGLIQWNIVYSDLEAAPNAMHIHVGAVGVGGGIQANLTITGSHDDPTPGSGTLIGNNTVSSDNANTILANPSGFYVNVHNADFPNGAIRAQIPEPSSAMLLSLAGLFFLRRRRR